MLWNVYIYELKDKLLQPSTYIYFAIFFLMAITSFLGSAGYWSGGPGSDGEIRLLNSPHEMSLIFMYFNKIFLFLPPAFVGTVMAKDFKDRAHHVMYSYPIVKFDYLMGKLLSAVTVVFGITLAVGAAFLLGELILGPEHAQIGLFNIQGYLSTYLAFVFPNMLIVGLLVFATVSYFRNIYAGFVLVLILVLIRLIAEKLFAGNAVLVALSDPLGQNAFAYEVRHWNLAQQNSEPIPLLGVVLVNRLFWLAAASGIFVLFYKGFTFSQEAPSKFFSLRTGITDPSPASVETRISTGRSDVRIDLSTTQQLKTTVRFAWMEFKHVVGTWMFAILATLGLLAIVLSTRMVIDTGDMALLPMTRIMLAVPTHFYSIIILLITFIFSGVLVHRSLLSRMDLLVDCTATSTWVHLLSKLLAIVWMQLLLLLIMMLAGMALQISNGYFHLELGLYVFHLLVLTFPTLLVWAILSVLVHVLFRNMYAGVFLLLLIWVGKDLVPHLGSTSYLLIFNSPPTLTYSDMNGYGATLAGNFLVTAYWLAFAGILVLGAHLFWRRGVSVAIAKRFSIAAFRFRGMVPYLLVFFFTAFTALAFGIYTEEQDTSTVGTKGAGQLLDFRKRYGKFKNSVQPDISSLSLSLDLFPASNSFEANGHYVLVNTSRQHIDTLLIRTGFDEITEYWIESDHTLIYEERNMKFAVHKLGNSLAPDDSLLLRFKIRNTPNTLFQGNSGVLSNGTFLKTDILPRIGYFLGKKERLPFDTSASEMNFYSSDADSVNMDVRISTSADQIAIAPGHLVSKWEQDGRNHYHYRTKGKVKLAGAFNSGVFRVRKEKYKGVDLIVYHHETHSYNLERILDGLRAALDYNGRYFSPFQHREASVIEFPVSEGTYASVMANSMPTSEQRFIAGPGDTSEKVDLSFYVVAHELTHHWWGNQLVPADAFGAIMLTESITEYISLRMYEQRYGKNKALNFLKLQRERYLLGRAGDSGKESPLYLVRPDQKYVAYGKGAIAFNSLKHWWGEEELNALLKDFLRSYRAGGMGYPTSVNFLDMLKDRLPAELDHLVIDMFETITFYDNALNKAELTLVDENRYRAKLFFDVKKYREDADAAQPLLDDLVEVGFYDKEGNMFHVEQFRISERKNVRAVLLDQEPDKVILDPNYLLIDKDLGDNTFRF